MSHRPANVSPPEAVRSIWHTCCLTRSSRRRPMPISRSDVIDAAARVITRRGDHRVPWEVIVFEAGNCEVARVSQWFEDLTALIDECYARTFQVLSDSLLRAETAPGTAVDMLA